jgi:hypothetical protein
MPAPPALLREAPRSESLFVLARGVATVVAVAALFCVAILVVIGKALVVTAAETAGLLFICGVGTVAAIVGARRWEGDFRVVWGALDM